MKVFITIERDGKPTGYDSDALKKCFELEESLNVNKIPCQLKITSLPRRKGWIRASELTDIES